MIPIKGYASFHPLKHCIVGRGHDPQDVADDFKETMHETNEDLDTLVNVLRSKGVVVHRPDIEDKTARPPISPRDYFIAVKDKLLVGKVIAGYKNILGQIDRQHIKWYLGNDISSGNMVRCGTHIHWDVSHSVQPDKFVEIKDWLHQHGFRVTVTRHGWHMDGMYSILKPGVIVAQRGLPELEEIYKGWNICYPESSHHKRKLDHEWSGNAEESNYNVNLLSVDESTCIIPNTNRQLIKFLEKNKIDPVVVTMRHLDFWDNGIHCMTQDLYREGDMEDYFRS